MPTAGQPPQVAEPGPDVGATIRSSQSGRDSGWYAGLALRTDGVAARRPRATRRDGLGSTPLPAAPHLVPRLLLGGPGDRRRRAPRTSPRGRRGRALPHVVELLARGRRGAPATRGSGRRAGRRRRSPRPTSPRSRSRAGLPGERRSGSPPSSHLVEAAVVVERPAVPHALRARRGTRWCGRSGRRGGAVAPPQLGRATAAGDDVVDEPAAESRCRLADMRAACTGFRNPGWKATMKRNVLVSRASGRRRRPTGRRCSGTTAAGRRRTRRARRRGRRRPCGRRS